MELLSFEYPLYVYYQVARQLFYQVGNEKGQEMFGGESPRFGPIGFDFKDAFGTYEQPMTARVDAVVEYLPLFLDKINRLRDDASCTEVMNIVKETSQAIGTVCRCELGCFRLMILLQGAIYLKVRIKPSTHLRKMFFPVKGSGSWSHIKEMGVDEEDIECVCYELIKEMSTNERQLLMDEIDDERKSYCVEEG